MEWVYLSHLINSIEFDRNLQDGSIEVDGGVEVSKRSPGKLRQLNTDTGLYVGELNICKFICGIIAILPSNKSYRSKLNHMHYVLVQIEYLSKIWKFVFNPQVECQTLCIIQADDIIPVSLVVYRKWCWVVPTFWNLALIRRHLDLHTTLNRAIFKQPFIPNQSQRDKHSA